MQTDPTNQAPAKETADELLPRTTCSPLWGEVMEENGRLYFRWDFDEYEDPKESQNEYYEAQEMLRGIGWEITDPQIEHDCISGPLGRYSMENDERVHHYQRGRTPITGFGL